MAVELTCCSCQRKLRVADEALGKHVKCPQCEQILLLAGSEQVPGHMESPVTTVADQWLLKTETDLSQYGPVSRSELEQWVSEGRVSPRSQVLRVGSSHWQWAEEVFPSLAGPSSAPARSAGPSFQANLVPSDRSRLTAGLLGLLPLMVGFCGIHRLYLGHVGIGLLQFITVGGCGVWQMIDVILVFAGAVRDAEGRQLRD